MPTFVSEKTMYFSESLDAQWSNQNCGSPINRKCPIYIFRICILLCSLILQFNLSHVIMIKSITLKVLSLKLFCFLSCVCVINSLSNDKFLHVFSAQFTLQFFSIPLLLERGREGEVGREGERENKMCSDLGSMKLFFFCTWYLLAA